jgi:benzoyl-CoA 2,3-dioxygenase component B
MREFRIEDPIDVRSHGVIDLPTLQRYLNFHFSVTIDLFGADQSSNAATFYSAGLKGRFEEQKRADDHVLKGASYAILEHRDGALVARDVPLLNALNEVSARRFHPRFGGRHRSAGTRSSRSTACRSG